MACFFLVLKFQRISSKSLRATLFPIPYNFQAYWHQIEPLAFPRVVGISHLILACNCCTPFSLSISSFFAGEDLGWNIIRLGFLQLLKWLCGWEGDSKQDCGGLGGSKQGGGLGLILCRNPWEFDLGSKESFEVVKKADFGGFLGCCLTRLRLILEQICQQKFVHSHVDQNLISRNLEIPNKEIRIL